MAKLNLSFYKIKVHKNYVLSHFNNDFRNVLYLTDCEGKSVVLFLEQPAILFSMLEVLNMFFANDIFEEIDQKTLFACIFKEAERIGMTFDTEHDLYLWFTMEL